MCAICVQRERSGQPPAVDENVDLQEAELLREGGCISDIYNEEGETVKTQVGKAIL